MRDLYFAFTLLLKRPFLAIKKVKLGKHNRLERGLFLSKSEIGNYNYIGHYSIIDKTQIGSYCSIGANTMIGGADHNINNPSTSFRINLAFEKPLTIIEDDVWIGAKATISAGVKIGRGAVIGASSYVNADVESYAVVVGVPAKKIKSRLDEKTILEIQKTKYWEHNPEEARKLLKGITFP